MALEVGQRQENPSEPKVDISALLKKRRSLNEWGKRHPDGKLLYEMADAAVGNALEKVRRHNERIYRLKKRISDEGEKPALVVSLKRASDRKKAVESRIPLLEKKRNALANNLYEWENLPLLNEEIAEAKNQLR